MRNPMKKVYIIPLIFIMSACNNVDAQTNRNKVVENEAVENEVVENKVVEDAVLIAAVDEVPSIEDQVQFQDYVVGLDEPWGFAFFPDNPINILITQKTGELLRYDGKKLNAIGGIPEVNNSRQGGLLDISFDPDYSENGWIYLSLSDPLKPGSDKVMTQIVRGRLEDDQWVDQQILFEADPKYYTKSSFHYGSRITFDNEGYLYFSVGDRGKREQAQDVDRPNGKIHRINRDGSVPADNPFVDGKSPTIWSYGNRNPQGLIIHPETGVLWETEHGPRGGDELNAIKKGVNYGWPKITYGINYVGTKITDDKALPGMHQPASQWTPSIAVCGLDVYTGDMFPEWKGRLMAGSLAYETLRLIDVERDQYKGEVTLFSQEGRIRDVTTGPDGAIYVALPERIVRITPKDG